MVQQLTSPHWQMTGWLLGPSLANQTSPCVAGDWGEWELGLHLHHAEWELGSDQPWQGGLTVCESSSAEQKDSMTQLHPEKQRGAKCGAWFAPP